MRLLRYKDLVARGIVANRATLGRWIQSQGFPAGIKLGPNTRAWSEEEIERWIAGCAERAEAEGAANARAAG